MNKLVPSTDYDHQFVRPLIDVAHAMRSMEWGIDAGEMDAIAGLIGEAVRRFLSARSRLCWRVEAARERDKGEK